MSVKLMTKVWASSLPTLEKLVLLALSDSASDENEYVCCIKNIAMKSSISTKEMVVVFNQLIADGILSGQLKNETLEGTIFIDAIAGGWK